MSDGPRSVPGKRREFAVAASPFNLIKLELGIILLIGLLWALAVGLLVGSALLQLGLLTLYGVGAMAWLIVRTRQILRKIGASPDGPK